MLYALSTRHKGEDTSDLPREVLVFSSSLKRMAFYNAYAGPGYAAVSVARHTLEEIEAHYREMGAKLLWKTPQRRSIAWIEQGIRKRGSSVRLQ